MKKMKAFCISALVISFLVAGCFNNRNNKNSSGGGDNSSADSGSSSSSSVSIIEKKVTVNFYLDFNQLEAKNVYYSTEADNGGLISQGPPTPTASNYPEFPVFKGWSQKEIIDDVNDLWDFSKDVVVANSGTLNLFGIWVAEGE